MLKGSFLAMCLFLSATFGGESFLNTLNTENGDFGGDPFTSRDKIFPFIEETNGEVTSFGFYIPTVEALGLVGTSNMNARGCALEFDTSILTSPEKFPYKFININYNPAGHPGAEYLVSHFDIHLWFEAPEYARGIQCDGTSFPPCTTTAYLASRFSKTAPQENYPAGYVNMPYEWVPTMGAHLVPQTIPDTFATTPAFIFGSYNGELIYYEPMVANTVFANVRENGAQTWAWPQVEQVPTGGVYFNSIRIEYEDGADGERYKFSFTDTWVAPSVVNTVPIFSGALLPELDLASEAHNSVSLSKDCLIASGSAVDGGYLIMNHAGKQFCCRSRGEFDTGVCTRRTCSGTAPLAYSYTSGFCYGKCYEA